MNEWCEYEDFEASPGVSMKILHGESPRCEYEDFEASSWCEYEDFE